MNRRRLGYLAYGAFLLLVVFTVIGLVRSRYVDERFVLEKASRDGAGIEWSYNHHRGVIIAKISQIRSERDPGWYFRRGSETARPVGLGEFRLGFRITRRPRETDADLSSTAILTSYWTLLTVGVAGAGLSWILFLRKRRHDD